MRILIVDDEIPIREWVAYSIQKQELNCEIIGLARNGQEAMEVFEREKPALIFTDIKMPVMDGIELLHRIKKENPTCYVVMLTSHSDFEYARQALSLGADEYILKTEIDDANIRKIINCYMERVESHKQQPTLLTDTMIKQIAQLGAEDKDIIAQYLQQSQINLKDTTLVAMAIQPKQNNIEEQLLGWKYDELDQLNHITWVQYEHDTIIMLMNIEALSQYKQFQVAYRVATHLSHFLAVPVSMSSVATGYAYMSKLIRQSITGLDRVFYQDDIGVITSPTGEEEEEIKSHLIELRNRLFRHIQDHKAQEAWQLLHKIIRNIQQKKIADISYVKQFYIQVIYEYALVYLEQHLVMHDIIADFKDKLKCIENYSQLVILVKDAIEAIIEGHQEDCLPYSEDIRRAIDYTTHHYPTIENITEISKKLHLSSEYFCRKFKSEVGCTYITYLTDIRMKKAIELLEKTDKKIYLIAKEIGYQSTSYFSKKFKQQFNINPYQYRHKI